MSKNDLHVTVNLEPVIEAKLSGFFDGLTANLTIIKDEYERALCLFQQANKAKREYFANWQAAAAENRRLVGMEQEMWHYKEEVAELQQHLSAVEAFYMEAKDRIAALEAERDQLRAGLDLQQEGMQKLLFAMFGRDLEPDEHTEIGLMVEWIEGLRHENTKIRDERDSALRVATNLAAKIAEASRIARRIADEIRAE